MFINNNNNYPTTENFQMKASGSINGGLIKTINSQNDFFCIKENCVYNLLIKVKHIEQLTLFASFVNNG